MLLTVRCDLKYLCCCYYGIFFNTAKKNTFSISTAKRVNEPNICTLVLGRYAGTQQYIFEPMEIPTLPSTYQLTTY